MALWRCRVPTGPQERDLEGDGVVVEADTIATARTLAKREIEFEEVSVDENGRTIAVEINDIVCERIEIED
ncbi:hypothetical protein [Aquisalimonas sp.]|uniref:hypothetical protein n=1 Tax=Aquisalimonas sp. TaxID=1872621 RepID=UPI0025C07182|nr:hypothetical protein [Aquisalimonas sp.]